MSTLSVSQRAMEVGKEANAEPSSKICLWRPPELLKSGEENVCTATDDA